MRSDETAITYLRGLHRRMKRARFGKSGDSRLTRIAKRWAAPIYWHVQPIVQAISEVSARHAGVKSTYGIGLLGQLRGCLAFTTSFRAAPCSYFDYRLFLRERWARRQEYLYYDELWPLLNWLNGELGPQDAADLTDKRRFHDRVSGIGLPTIPILAEFDRGTILHRRSLHDYPTSDLFSKFADRWQGEGAHAWRRSADGSYSGDRQSRLTLTELLETLRASSFEHPVILQPRIVNHRELQPLSGNGLSTVRALTIQDMEGRISLALACFRMAAGALVADNFAAGGLAAAVGLDDGRLGSAVFKSRVGVFLTHPDSGATIAGRSLPHWAEVKRLAVAAHQEFKRLPSIGWDIAITEDGPLIVEGNGEWGTNVVQLSHQTPLAATSIPDRLAEHFHRLAETHDPPGVTRPRRRG